MAWAVSGAGMIPSVFGEEAGRLKHRVLGIGPGLDDLFVHQLAEKRGVAVVAQAAGVDARRHEGVAQGVHQDQGGEAGGVPEVVGVGPLGQGGAGSGLHRHEADVLALELVRHEGEAEAGEVAAAADAADEHVRLLPGQGQLLFGLQPDDGLVQHDVVEDAPQGSTWCPRGWRRPPPPRRWPCPGCRRSRGRWPGCAGRPWCGRWGRGRRSAPQMCMSDRR